MQYIISAIHKTFNIVIIAEVAPDDIQVRRRQLLHLSSVYIGGSCKCAHAESGASCQQLFDGFGAHCSCDSCHSNDFLWSGNVSMGDMNAVKNNPEMKSFKLLQVAGIQREANSNIKYYEESLRKSNGNYLSGKVTGKGILKVRKEMQEEIYFYRISLQLYSLSKMIEVVLSDNFDIDSLRMRELLLVR